MTRSTFCSLRSAVLSSSLTLAISGVAAAQSDQPGPAPATTAVPPPPPAEVLPPPAPVEPPPAALPTVVEPVAPSAPVVVPAEAAPAPAEAATEEEADKPWYEDFSVGGFVDAYGAIRSDSNRKRAPSEAGLAPVQLAHEAYVQADGFALAFAGLDASYSGEKFGATISLRFGPAVNRFYGGDKGALGIDNFTQAFATWKPTDKLTFDIGQFGTLYGAEVAESWRNVNYSRGALYYAMQPFWHTGVRSNIKLSDSFALNAMVVNGVNNAFEDNKSPTLGLQALITPGDSFALAAGYMGALNPRDGGNGLFHNFFDVVATVTLGDFKVVGNFDYNQYKLSGADSENWWGVSVAPAYAFTDYFGVGLRAEYLSDSANVLFAMPDAASMPDEDGVLPTIGDATSLTTLTATLDIKPVPGSAALVIRPEFRYEVTSDDYYTNKDGELTDNFWVASIGVVVTSLP